MSINDDERKELESLRRYKLENESKALNKAFYRLETLLQSPHDPAISLRAFRVVSECLIALKERLDE